MDSFVKKPFNIAFGAVNYQSNILIFFQSDFEKSETKSSFVKKTLFRKNIFNKKFKRSKENKLTLSNNKNQYTPKEKHKKNFLVTIYYVKKFIQVIKTYTMMRKIFKLQNYHFNTIGDNSNFYTKGGDFGDNYFSSLLKKNARNFVKFIKI